MNFRYLARFLSVTANFGYAGHHIILSDTSVKKILSFSGTCRKRTNKDYLIKDICAMICTFSET